MTDFTWINLVRELSPAALTVRAQALSPNDQDRLLWDAFFPRRDVDSVDLKDITTLDYRPTADRREWNADGRYVPMLTPAQRELTMVPIESYDKIEEQEMQKLMERSLGNAEIIKQIIGASLPARTDRLVQADYRRLELDAFAAWANGAIVQRNPQTGATYTASFGFDANRYQTAATAWNDGGVNAYNEFLAWVQDAIETVGPVAGVIMRLATLKEIQADAPQGVMQLPLTRAQLFDRVQQDLGQAFRFYIMEHTVGEFQTAGSAVTQRKVWPAQKVAIVPAGEQVGFTAFAPVVRAMQLAAAVPEAGIDIRGVTVYHNAAAQAKELTIAAQLNAMPVPDEQKMFVIDAGV